MKKSGLLTLVVAGGLIVTSLGCARGRDDSTAAGNSNSSKNANAQEPLLGPLVMNTARGDLERAGVAITGARQYIRENNWDAAASLLKSASNSIGEAVTKKTRASSDFQELRAAIEKAIRSVQNHGSDSDNQIAQLEAWIRALKVHDS